MTLVALLAAALQAPPADTALRVSTAVAPETVTVGDPFRSLLRVHAPPGARVEFHGLATGDTVQPVDTVVGVRGGPRDGATAVYRAVAWVAGVPLAARVRVRVMVPGDSTREHRLALRLPVVRSVLPAGGEELRPRPARPPFALSAPRPLWPWLAAAGAVLLAGTLVWWRRRRRRPPAAEDPRAAALRALDELAAAGAAPRATVDRAIRVLRRYLEAVEPAWSEAWTDSELLARLDPARMSEADRAALAVLLEEVGVARFAGAPISAAQAEGLRGRARHWIAGYREPVPHREAA